MCWSPVLETDPKLRWGNQGRTPGLTRSLKSHGKRECARYPHRQSVLLLCGEASTQNALPCHLTNCSECTSTVFSVHYHGWGGASSKGVGSLQRNLGVIIYNPGTNRDAMVVTITSQDEFHIRALASATQGQGLAHVLHHDPEKEY